MDYDDKYLHLEESTCDSCFSSQESSSSSSLNSYADTSCQADIKERFSYSRKQKKQHAKYRYIQ